MGRGWGAFEPRCGKQVLIQVRDRCRLEWVREVVDLSLVEAVLKPGIKQIALDQEVFEGSGYSRPAGARHLAANQV